MTNEVTTNKQSESELFTNDVLAEFKAISGHGVEFSLNQKRLAQHMFVKADAVLKELEAKRLADNKNNVAQYIWSNINLSKMAIDSVNRIELGLDALISNHISMIPYFNHKTKKYALDLRIGYVGKDYYVRKHAIDPPKDVIYELVHKTDVLTVFKKDADNDVETYKFEVKNPFERGEVVGGFGYIVFDDPTKNKLILVSEADFLKSKNDAATKKFWDKDPEAMRYKTIVNRVAGKIQIDPEKVGNSYFQIEQQEQNPVEDDSDGDQEQIIELSAEQIEPPEPEKKPAKKPDVREPVKEDAPEF